MNEYLKSMEMFLAKIEKALVTQNLKPIEIQRLTKKAEFLKLKIENIKKGVYNV